MIPKVIHYCWFGRNPLPKSARKCIESWRKFFPDHEIKEWNEDNFDVNIIPYTSQAYEAKKYAFVSDYARFWILYHHGGIYFDTDVEVIRPMDDIIACGGFMGREAGALMRNICKDLELGHNGFAVAPGLALAIEAGHKLYRQFLDTYNSLHFINHDGSYNEKTVVSYITEVLVTNGLNDNNDEPVCLDGIWIYPADYFCPQDHTRSNILTITNRTRSIHHYDASWRDHSTMRYKLAQAKKWIVRKIHETKQKIKIW